MADNNVIFPPVHLIKYGDTVKISQEILWGATQKWFLEFEFSGEICLSADPDPWLVLTLLPAMRAGLDLEFTRPVSPQLLKNIELIQTIFHQWDKTFQKITI